jgi:hypothetical protein
MAFNMDGYVDVAERIRLAIEKWPEASFQNMATRLVSCKDQTFVEVTVALYRTPEDARPAIATAWEPIPGLTPYTKDSEMMNAETSAMGRAVIAAGIPSKKVASAEEIRNRKPAGETDPWTGEVAEPNPAIREVKILPRHQCKHGEMKYWQSSKTGKELFFCPLGNDDPDKCDAVDVVPA